MEPTSLLFVRCRGYFPGVKRPEREVDFSRLVRGLVQLFPIYLHGMGRDNFALF
jgi:hypothetical protein